MKSYRINTDRLVNIFTPLFIRGENHVKFVQALLRPFQTLNDNFVLEAQDRKIQANMTSQVLLFEWYLNYKFEHLFDVPTDKIRIVHTQDLSSSLFYEAESSPEEFILFNEAEASGVDPILFIENETTVRLTESFWLSVPKNKSSITEEDYTNGIKVEIEKYRLAGKTYAIKIKQ